VLRDSQFLLWAAPKNYLRFSVAQALMPGTRIARRPPDFPDPPPASRGNRAWYLGGSIIPGINRIMQVLAYAVRWHVPEPERRAWWTSAAIQPRPSFLRDVPPAAAQRQPWRLGTMRSTVLYMAPDFDAPLDDFREYME
jgi:hypothetical protein